MTKDEKSEYDKQYYLLNKEHKKSNLDKVGRNEYMKNYRLSYKEPDERKTYIKEYRKNNKNKIKQYYKDNKKSILAKQVLTNKKRRKNDPVFKLAHTLRRRVRESFKNNNYTKKSKTYQILGCTFEQLKQHIEAQFKSWMSWDNHGLYNGTFNYGWDIDHIEPLANAKTEADIIRLNHYTNLQPLCSKINRDIKRDN